MRLKSFISLSILGLLAATSLATEPTNVTTAEPMTPAHRLQLDNCKAGILDSQARSEDRRRWIATLFAFETPHAYSLVVELLTHSDNPDAQQAVCDAVANHARSLPEVWHQRLLPPLLAILGSESATLRSAAARALASFRSDIVLQALGDIAASQDAGLAKRLAAIDALVFQVDRRSVIRVLMKLLDTGHDQITARVLAALEPASRETFGHDLARWQTWWEQKSRLTEEAWLEGQLQLYRDRLRNQQQTALSETARAQQRLKALDVELREFQNEVFRSLTPEQHDRRLADWLSRPVDEVKLTALTIIQTLIADEGRKPEGPVLQALLALLESQSSDIRSETLLIVQNLNDPEVIAAVLSQFRKENNLAVRHAILKALGNLNDPLAIPDLIAEIQDQNADLNCVREAAIALGKVFGKIDATTVADSAIEALRLRYRDVAPDNTALRAAILAAMTGAKNQTFSSVFLEAVETSDAQILREAIRGLQAIGDSSKLARLRTLTADEDVLVRLAAVDAVGTLGKENADLERVASRMDPATEPNELVRNSATTAFRNLLAGKTFDARIKAAMLLQDTPDLEVSYLEELAEALSKTNNDKSSAEKLHNRAGAVLRSAGKFNQASNHLRILFELVGNRDKNKAFDVGLTWLDTSLRSDQHNDLGKILGQLPNGEWTEEQMARTIETIDQWLQSPDTLSRADHAAKVIAEFQEAPSKQFGDDWQEMLARAAERLSTAQGQTDENSATTQNP